jgi:DNA-binding NtrC family response regulator
MESEKSANSDLRTLPLERTRDGGPPHRVSLLVQHEGGVEAVELSPGRPLVLGRAGPADIIIEDLSLSRQHVRFELRQEAVLVEDLGSTNGTVVNGQLVESAQIRTGDRVTAGTVSVTVHALAEPVSGIEGQGRFTTRLQEEAVRARFLERPLALVLVRRLQAGPRDCWWAAVQPHLRPVDRMGLLAEDTVAVLLPEAGQEQAMGLARSVTGAEGGGQLVCGLALFPQSGASAAKLLKVGLRAVGQADADSPIISVETQPDPRGWMAEEGRLLDTRTVVVAPAMREVFSLARQLAEAMIPVLIQGETGTGKEVVARAIHSGGARRDGPMRCLNCSAIPDQLIESVLFGHERGAFTGAVRQSRGLFEEASGGTVLLDEVGELAPNAQAVLLRVLETKRITRVGSSDEIEVDVRVLAATHRDLESMCEEGSFRWDLLYRLNTMTLYIPPLRERREEIGPLVEVFLGQACQDAGGRAVGVSEAAWELLRAYHWPGNVRELRNEIERAVVICRNDQIQPEDLSERLQGQRPPPAVAPEPGPDIDGLNYRVQVRQFEQGLIRRALEHAEWNVTAAARLLGIPRRTLTYRMRSLSIKRPGR